MFVAIISGGENGSDEVAIFANAEAASVALGVEWEEHLDTDGNSHHAGQIRGRYAEYGEHIVVN